MRFERLLIFLMVLSIFLDDYIIGYSSNEARAASPFDFYYYYLIFLTFLFYYLVKIKKVPWLPSWFLTPLMILFISSFITGLSLGNLSFSMAKQVIGITFSSIAYYNLIRYTKYDLTRLFNIYLNIAFYVAIYGVIEEFLLLRGIYILSDNVKLVSGGFYRVYSIMGEPYFLAVALIPALYHYLNKFFGVKSFRQRKTFIRLGIILACYVFTFSSAGIIGLGLMFAFILYNHGYFTPTNVRFILLILIVLLFFPSGDKKLFSLKEFEVRMADSYKAFSNSDNLTKAEIAKFNSSTFALYSNYVIAQKSFSENPISGSGLGSHEKTYDEYFGSLFGKKFLIMYGEFNQKDGNSLFIRLMSETGLIGLTLIFLFVFRFMLGRKQIRNPEMVPYIIINQGIFIVFIIRLMRTGNYIGQGFFFFFFLYYFTYLMAKNRELHSGEPK